MSATAGQALNLQVSRTFDAPREKVFAAWTDPEAVKQWHASEEYRTTVAEMDVREGGRYRFEFEQVSDGVVKPVWGVYQEVKAPERLVYTWNVKSLEMDVKDTKDTVVTVEFRDKGAQTEVTVTHELFTSAEVMEAHKKGWNGCFDRLPGTL